MTDGRSADIPDEVTCQDREGLVVNVNDETQEDCWFLVQNDQFGYLCDWIDVALACPVTCGICSSLEAIECGADNVGDVELDGTVGHASCDFLADTVDRFGFACRRTSVALHCPVTCEIETCQA